MTKTACLLPGFGGTGAFFNPLCHAVGARLETHVISYGDSRSVEGHLTTAESQIPDDRPVSLIAESFSGPIAVELLRRANRDYEALVLCATFARCPYGTLVALARLLPSWVFRVNSLSLQVLKFYCLSPDTTSSLEKEATEIINSVPSTTLKRRLRSLSELDVTAALPDVMVPTLILQAARDRLIPRRLQRELAEGLPAARTITVDGPHMLLQSNPNECAGLILEHLNA